MKKVKENKIQFVLLLAIIWTNACSSITKPSDGIFLIPESFEGGVIIIFNQPDGITPNVENGRYVYRIPPTGLLKVKSDSVVSWQQIDYFYINDRDERQTIYRLNPKGWTGSVTGWAEKNYDDLTQNEYENDIFASAYMSGTFNAKGKVVKFRNFVVCKLKDGEQITVQMHEKISKIQRETILSK